VHFVGFRRQPIYPRLWEVADNLEQAISDIQLFGTPEQVQLAQRFGEDLGKNQAAELDSLLTELRYSLRRELGMDPVPGRMLWLRVERKEQSD